MHGLLNVVFFCDIVQCNMSAVRLVLRVAKQSIFSSSIAKSRGELADVRLGGRLRPVALNLADTRLLADMALALSN